MLIVVITPYWLQSDGGGILTYLINLIEELRKKEDTDIQIIYRQGKDPANYRVNGGKLVFGIKSFMLLVKIKPDVIHSQAYWWCLLPGYLYRTLYKCRLIHTIRSEPAKKLHLFPRFFYQRLINRCDCVTFVSKGLKAVVEDMEGLYFNKWSITYPGARIRSVSAIEIQNFCHRYNVENGLRILLVQGFTANAIKAQGLKCVIDCIPILKMSGYDVLLIITREGKYSPELKKYVEKLKLSDNVLFTGDLENPSVPLKLCDIFLFPWLGKSGLGNSLLEAMIMGKPIIATSIDEYGVSETISHGVNGLLVPPDVSVMASSIRGLLDDKGLQTRIGQNAKNDAMLRFSWHQCAENFNYIYNHGCGRDS